MNIWIILLLSTAVVFAEHEDNDKKISLEENEKFYRFLDNLFPNKLDTFGTYMNLRDTYECCRDRLREFKLFRLRGGNYYSIVRDATANWHTAREECSKRGMLLAEFFSYEEYEALLRYLKDNSFLSEDGQSYWIGGNDLATEGRFNWLIGNERGVIAATAFSWASGQPAAADAPNENCLEIRRFTSSNIGVNDYVCGQPTKGYICKAGSTCRHAFEFIYDSSKRPTLSSFINNLFN